MIKYDKNISGNGILSVYVTKEDRHLYPKLTKKFGKWEVMYIDHGKVIGKEWFLKVKELPKLKMALRGWQPKNHKLEDTGSQLVSKPKKTKFEQG